MKECPNATFKCISGTDYLYIAIYDEEASKLKREQLKAEGCSKEEIRSKGSVYKYVYQGKWDLDNPCPKLLKFLDKKPPEYIQKLNDKYIARLRKRVAKQTAAIKKEEALQQ